MKLIGMLVAAYMVSGPSGPEITIIPHDYYPLDQCRQEAARLTRDTPAETLDRKGRQVLLRNFTCILSDDSWLEYQAQQIKKE